MGASGGVALHSSGSAELKKASRRLRGAPKEIRKQFKSEFSKATKPIIDAAKESASKTLPGGGGKGKESVADRVSGGKYSAKMLSGASAGTRITAMERAGKNVDMASLNRGRLRHPLYGNKRHWYDQNVPKDWFTKPIEEYAPKLEKALGDVAEKIIKDVFG